MRSTEDVFLRLDGPVVLVGAGGAGGADPGVADALAALAAQEGWRLLRVHDAEAARWAASARKASLVVATGPPSLLLETVRAVRRSATTPLVVIGPPDPPTRARLLADGADVVLPPGPPDPHELRGWIGALLRRAGEQPSVRYLGAGSLQLDLWARSCRRDGTVVPLSPTEFRLLAYLMGHPCQALPTLRIAQRLWGGGGGAHDLNALRIQVSRLRRKIGGRFIRSVRGVGYEFTETVLELGDGPADGYQELDALVLPRTMLELGRGLHGRPPAQAAAYAATTLRASLGCDAVAVFRRRTDRMELIAEHGNSPSWRAAVRDGVPLRPGFAQVHALQTRQPTQVADIHRGPVRYRETARALAADGYHSCLFVPILTAAGGWGGLGLASRSRRPFDPAATVFAVAVAALLALVPPPDRLRTDS
jgi:DNA-binding response OmpR family regulator